MTRRRVLLPALGAAIVAIATFVFAVPASAQAPAHHTAHARRGFGHAHGSSSVTPHAGGSVLVSPTTLTFPTQRAGTFSGVSRTVTVTNNGSVDVTFSDLITTTADYFGSTTCFDDSLPMGESCTITIFFMPNTVGSRPATLKIVDDAAGSPQPVSLSGTGIAGYYVAGAHGQVAGFGDAADLGDATNVHLTQPIISIKTTSNGDGFWLLGSDGGIFSYGNAKFYGSTGAIHLNKPVVGMERTETGHGYWLVASDGGIFSFGDAKFYGSTGAIHLNQPIVGMVARPDGHGYWMHARDGGLFAFGDAPFYGSAAASHLAIAGMATTADGRGYWMVATDGAVFHYGDAPSLGDLPSAGVATSDVIGIAPTTPPLPIEFF